MIYTNKIQETAKELEQKLNEKLGSKIVKVFNVTFNDTILKIEVSWTMDLEELQQIHEIIGGNAFVTSSEEGNVLQIWTCYDKEGE